MKVLVSCERSGIVRDAFALLGHDAISCDLSPADNGGKHYTGNVFDIINDGFDLMIGHPPCTYLTLTANKWLKEQPKRKSGALVGKERQQEREKAIAFFMALYNCSIPRICLENPIGVMSTVFRKPDQIIQPYYFGDSAKKTTCLWLKNLPKLYHSSKIDLFSPDITHVDQGEIITTKSGNKMPKWYAYADKSKGQEERARIRSQTFPGIANAMAEQWNF